LTLAMFPEDERALLYAAYAPDPRMRLNVGIRRRLAPLLGFDRQRIELMHSLLMTLPGAPILYYGDEIGMADDIALPDRHGVRTPMQWDASPQAGFTDHPSPYMPLIEHPTAGWRHNNVASQEADPDSLLHWVRKLVRTRKGLAAVGGGAFTYVDTGDDRLCVFRHEAPDGAVVLAVHNVSAETVTAELPVPAGGRLRRVLAGRAKGPDEVDDGRLPIWLEAHGYAWWSREAP
jgi:maltose alpha-D-glucosyltransferase / alpha-amylase